MATTDVQDQYQRLQAMPGILGVMIINQDGLPIRSTLNYDDTLKFASNLTRLIEKSRKTMRELALNEGDDTLIHQAGTRRSHHHHEFKDDITFIRIRTRHYEVLISPCEGEDYITIALQKPIVDEDEEETEGTAATVLTGLGADAV